MILRKLHLLLHFYLKIWVQNTHCLPKNEDKMGPWMANPSWCPEGSTTLRWPKTAWEQTALSVHFQWHVSLLKCTEKSTPARKAPVHEIIPSQKTKVTEISAAGSSGKYRLQEFISRWHSYNITGKIVTQSRASSSMSTTAWYWVLLYQSHGPKNQNKHKCGPSHLSP